MRLLTLLVCSLATRLAQALYVTAGSPCSSACNSNNGTWYPDLVCPDSDYTQNATGELMKQCLECQSQSLYVNGSRSDEYWFLYHMKFTQQYCLVDSNSSPIPPVAKCGTQCAPLTPVLSVLWISHIPFLPQYNYCTNFSSAYPTYGPACAKCLQAQEGSVILGNMVETMVNACNSTPLAVSGDLVKTTRDVFNDTVIPLAATATNSSATEPSATPQSSAPPGNSSLSPGVAAGIAVGAALLVAGVIVGIFFLLRRRKSRRMDQAGLEFVPPQPPMKSGDIKGYPPVEMYVQSPLVELHGHQRVEADSTASVDKTLPIAELPVHPYR